MDILYWPYTHPVEAVWSLILGLGASVVYALLDRRRRTIQDKRNYGKFQGDYKAYVFVKDSEGKDTDVLVDASSGCVKLGYKETASLSIGHFQDKGLTVWNGEIAMDSILQGHITWFYEKVRGEEFNEKKFRFGFKRISKHGERLLLTGEDGFGKEVLIRKPKPSNCAFCGTTH